MSGHVVVVLPETGPFFATSQATSEDLGLLNDGTVINSLLVLMKLDPDKVPRRQDLLKQFARALFTR